MTKAATTAKPAVLDSTGTELERLFRVVVDHNGSKVKGTVTGIEHQRARVVIKLDDQEKLIVRPAAKVRTHKVAGKIIKAAPTARKNARKDA